MMDEQGDARDVSEGQMAVSLGGRSIVDMWRKGSILFIEILQTGVGKGMECFIYVDDEWQYQSAGNLTLVSDYYKCTVSQSLRIPMNSGCLP